MKNYSRGSGRKGRPGYRTPSMFRAHKTFMSVHKRPSLRSTAPFKPTI